MKARNRIVVPRRSERRYYGHGIPGMGAGQLAGKLIVVEGIDGSGKSTQISLLSHWLRSQGYAVAFSEWNSSPLVRDITRRGKKKRMLTPSTFSLIHATDFADRMESYILPLVKSGAIVCADRYAYTAFARDVVRGVSSDWVRNLYRFAIRPNVAFYFRVPLDVALGRIPGRRRALPSAPVPGQNYRLVARCCLPLGPKCGLSGHRRHGSRPMIKRRHERGAGGRRQLALRPCGVNWQSS